MSLSEKIQQKNSEIGASVDHALTELRREISQRLRAGNDEIQRWLDQITPSLPSAFLSHDDFTAHEHEVSAGARQGAQRELRDALAGIDRARSQADILAAMLRESSRYASRVAVLLVRGGELRGWGSEGFGDAGSAALRGLVLTEPEGAWSRLAQATATLPLTASDCAALCSRLESPLPQEGVLVPVVLRDRVAAGLYADRLDGGELAVEALQILAHAAAQAIETLPFRERASTPTLPLDGGVDGGGAPATAAGTPVASAPAAPAPAAEPEPVQPPATPEAQPETPPEAHAEAAPEPAHPEPEPPAAEPVAPPPARSVAPTQGWAPSIPHVTEAMPLPGIPHPPAPADVTPESPLAAQPDAAEPMAEEVPRYPRSVEPEPSPDATVLLQRSSFQTAEAPPPPAPAPPLRPVPPPEEPVAHFDRAAGTPEVRPPSDVAGPGWAFATTRMPVSSDNQAQHEEARRLARLLVSEIKLYNEEQVEEGRRNRDIYERLREDIDRSRQMYDERVDPQILRSTDYFYQELVRILAAGDSKALGI